MRCLDVLSDNTVPHTGPPPGLAHWLLVIVYVSRSERSSKNKSSRATLEPTPSLFYHLPAMCTQVSYLTSTPQSPLCKIKQYYVLRRMDGMIK